MPSYETFIGSYKEHPPEATFKERVASANNAEKRKEVADYLYKEMYPAIGSPMAALMKTCLSKPNASLEKFSIVANLKDKGHFSEVDAEPVTNTSECLKAAFAQLKPPSLSNCNCNPLPIVIDMTIAP